MIDKAQREVRQDDVHRQEYRQVSDELPCGAVSGQVEKVQHTGTSDVLDVPIFVLTIREAAPCKAHEIDVRVPFPIL